MKNILEMRSITKLFPGVKALDNVNLAVRDKEIHALVGENGAGKSTLMNVLSGIYPFGSYTGEIYFNENICKFKNIKDSEKLGIVIIHQELALIPYLSIAENIFLGNEQAKKGIINWDQTMNKASELIRRVGLDESPSTLINNIGVGKQQLVEIAKALSKNVSLLILDEPTAALNDEDSKILLDLLIDLKRQGVSSILISHKLNEVSKVADRITVIRDGATIETIEKEKEGINEDRIIRGMVGRDIIDRFPKRNCKIGDIAFEIEDWNVYDQMNEDRQIIKSVSLNVRKGEIVGIAGLMGSGRTEFAMSVFGRAYGRKITGQIKINNKVVTFRNVSEAIKGGLAYVTEDRKNYGLVLIDDIKSNITLANLKKVSRGIVVDDNQEIRVAEDFRKKINIKSPSILQKTGNLSGGNQQKVVLSKWMFSEPEVLILDEPTRGIDIGAKYEIYLLINALAAEGKSIIIISSELPEVLGMSDRIYVMSEGRIVGELTKNEASQESIMKCIINS